MILWFVLFLLVVATSFVLAYQSMKDFQETPDSLKAEYGLFLIRNPSHLTTDLVQTLHDQVVTGGLIVSIERLFRGQESALVVFGPRQLLLTYRDLNLLELEDYTGVDQEQVRAWEVGIKNKTALAAADFNLFGHLPELKPDELFWWQVILRPRSQIRCVFFSVHPERRHQIGTELQNLAPNLLSKVPKPFTSSQILKFYQQRSLSTGKNETDNLNSVEVVNLVKF